RHRMPSRTMGRPLLIQPRAALVLNRRSRVRDDAAVYRMSGGRCDPAVVRAGSAGRGRSPRTTSRCILVIAGVVFALPPAFLRVGIALWPCRRIGGVDLLTIHERLEDDGP